MTVALNPRRKSEIADLLSQSYDCIESASYAKRTWASKLKEYPTYYLRGICSNRPATHLVYYGEDIQKTMDWASWELARSTLDESVKNSVGILLYLDKIGQLRHDPIAERVSEFNPEFLSSFAFSSLYFSHLHSTMSGLCLAGVVFRDSRVIVRDISTPPYWKCIDDSWEICWTRVSPARHARIFERYDAIQGHRTKWLPPRSTELRSLKSLREAITYHTERLGGWNQREAVDRIKEAFPHHIRFQEEILESLCEVVEDRTWDRTFNPKLRTAPFRRRFSQYKDLASCCL